MFGVEGLWSCRGGMFEGYLKHSTPLPCMAGLWVACVAQDWVPRQFWVVCMRRHSEPSVTWCAVAASPAAVVSADSDHDGYITLADFVPMYKTIAAVRRAFRRQDHHNNGQIDRYSLMRGPHNKQQSP